MKSLRQNPTIGPLTSVLLSSLLGLGCASSVNNSQASPYRDHASLRAIFKPMTMKSAKKHVLCDYLQVDLSRELYSTGIIATYNDHYHQRRLVRAKNGSLAGPESTYTFLNHKGKFDSPLNFMIGEATFTVLGRAVFRLYGKGAARFDLRATGHVSVIAEGKSSSGGAVRIRNGVWQQAGR